MVMPSSCSSTWTPSRVSSVQVAWITVRLFDAGRGDATNSGWEISKRGNGSESLGGVGDVAHVHVNAVNGE